MRNEIESVAPGVTVFGTAVIKVAPDSAAVAVAASRVEQGPKDAFAAVRKAGAQILKFLEEGRFGDFGSSRITLSREHEYARNETRFVGYKAKIGYTIALRDLARIEELLSGVVAAGANDFLSVTFESNRLDEVRAEARRRAVADARGKAELYCKEAGVSLGPVIAIQDKNPEHVVLGERQFLTGGCGGASERAIDPVLMPVGASVYLTFEIAPNETR